MQSYQASKISTSDNGFGMVHMLKGLLTGYIVTFIVLIIFAFILTFTDFPEKLIHTAVTIATIISILMASSSTGRNSRNMGWLNGGIAGLVYMVILYALGSALYVGFMIDGNVLSMAAIGVCTGAVGGVIGINLKKKLKCKSKF